MRIDFSGGMMCLVVGNFTAHVLPPKHWKTALEVGTSVGLKWSKRWTFHNWRIAVGAGDYY